MAASCRQGGRLLVTVCTSCETGDLVSLTWSTQIGLQIAQSHYEVQIDMSSRAAFLGEPDSPESPQISQPDPLRTFFRCMKLVQGEIDDRAIRAAMSSRAASSTPAMRRTFRGPWPCLVRQC